MAEIDAYVAENGTGARESDLGPVNWQPTAQQATLDLRRTEIGRVIHTTGFHFDFGQIVLLLFDERG